MPKKGWLQEQFKEVKKDIATWPLWMRKVANLEDRAVFLINNRLSVYWCKEDGGIQLLVKNHMEVDEVPIALSAEDKRKLRDVLNRIVRS